MKDPAKNQSGDQPRKNEPIPVEATIKPLIIIILRFVSRNFTVGGDFF